MPGRPDVECRALQHLQLNENQLVGAIPERLSTYTELRTLTLHYNRLTGPIPAALGQLANLEVPRWTTLEPGPMPTAVVQAPTLADADRARRLRPTPRARAWRAQLAMFNNNDLSGPVPETFAQCTTMRALTFSHEAGRATWQEGVAYRDNASLYVTAGVKARIVAALGEVAMSRPAYVWWPESVPTAVTWPREVEDGHIYMHV